VPRSAGGRLPAEGRRDHRRAADRAGSHPAGPAAPTADPLIVRQGFDGADGTIIDAGVLTDDLSGYDPADPFGARTIPNAGKPLQDCLDPRGPPDENDDRILRLAVTDDVARRPRRHRHHARPVLLLQPVEDGRPLRPGDPEASARGKVERSEVFDVADGDVVGRVGATGRWRAAGPGLFPLQRAAGHSVTEIKGQPTGVGHRS
jgi:hypothetical protein